MENPTRAVRTARNATRPPTDALTGPSPVASTPLQRLLAKTTPAPGGCLIYTGGTRGHGFGAFWFEGANEAAHRVVWLLQVGRIDDGHVVAQSCRNRRCVALEHLDAVPGRSRPTACTGTR